MRQARLVLAVALWAVVTLLSSGLAWSASAPGAVSAPDQTLRGGCHAYRYHYRVTVPQGDWELETWLYDPRGKQRGYGYHLVGGDPRNNRHATFRLCRADVVPGRFTIKATLRWYDDPLLPILPPTEHEARLAAAHFRLSRP